MTVAPGTKRANLIALQLTLKTIKLNIRILVTQDWPKIQVHIRIPVGENYQ